MTITALAIVIIAVALAFDYTNGFQDAANAIAAAVSTRAMTPRIALAMAAVMNVLGALVRPRWPPPSAKTSSSRPPAGTG